MLKPHEHPHRILLAVTGLSPQIVTETLYALAVAQRPAFVPTEVHVVTTTEGARLVREILLARDGGQFHELLSDYPEVGSPAFGEKGIHLLTGPDGNPMADIRTPQDNAAAADSIAKLVAALTLKADSALHVSIAGGRKTMGFYLGYAFSLYARPQDRLSHVLVNTPFESHPEFFFPPRPPRRLETRGGGHIDTAGALVTLGEIPVVRLRHGLPAALQNGKASFSDTVAALQTSFSSPQLDIDVAAARVACGGHQVPMKPQLVAWFCWWAWLRKEGGGDGAGLVVWRDADASAFLRIYRAVAGENSAAYEKTAALLSKGMEKEFFQQKNSRLEKALMDAMGPAAEPYLLAQAGKRPRTGRGLTLPPKAIRLSGLPRGLV